MAVEACGPCKRSKSMHDSISIGQVGEDAGFLSGLINQVYAVAEAGMWQNIDGKPMPRTDAKEVQELLAKQTLLIARQQAKVVGCVCVQMLSPTLAEFGLLVADPNCRGEGIGRALLLAAEEYGRTQGASTMQLELLTPKNWQHPVKDFLHRWYTRIGYVSQGTEPFAKTYGHLAAHLATPCNFTVYHKTL